MLNLILFLDAGKNKEQLNEVGNSVANRNQAYLARKEYIRFITISAVYYIPKRVNI